MLQFGAADGAYPLFDELFGRILIHIHERDWLPMLKIPAGSGSAAQYPLEALHNPFGLGFPPRKESREAILAAEPLQ